VNLLQALRSVDRNRLYLVLDDPSRKLGTGRCTGGLARLPNSVGAAQNAAFSRCFPQSSARQEGEIDGVERNDRK